MNAHSPKTPELPAAGRSLGEIILIEAEESERTAPPPMVRFFWCHATVGRNSRLPIVLLFGSEWREAHIRNRGLRRMLIERRMTAAETGHRKSLTRASLRRYSDLLTLLQDEWRETRSRQWVGSLRVAFIHAAPEGGITGQDYTDATIFVRGLFKSPFN